MKTPIRAEPVKPQPGLESQEKPERKKGGAANKNQEHVSDTCPQTMNPTAWSRWGAKNLLPSYPSPLNPNSRAWEMTIKFHTTDENID